MGVVAKAQRLDLLGPREKCLLPLVDETLTRITPHGTTQPLDVPETDARDTFCIDAQVLDHGTMELEGTAILTAR